MPMFVIHVLLAFAAIAVASGLLALPLDNESKRARRRRLARTH